MTITLEDLNFEYPEALIATEPRTGFRGVLIDSENNQISELNKQNLLDVFKPGEVLVINETQVLKRRVFTENQEILFLDKLEGRNLLDSNLWSVLFNAKKAKIGQSVPLPGGISMELVEKGIPQTVRLSTEISESYFNDFGDLALPPYIQSVRNDRKNVKEDLHWYQTDWANKPGSYAAPTASLHFSNEDLEVLKEKGVEILKITLHVGLGTFLPHQRK